MQVHVPMQGITLQEAMLAELVEYHMQQLDVLIPGVTVHEYIVKEYKNTMV